MKEKMEYDIILASTSPRRKELLEKTNLSFHIDTVAVDETCGGTSQERVKELSGRKAEAVAEKYPKGLILAADTLVEYEQIVLGKPDSSQQACEMLKTLSGKWHHVYTGICVYDVAQKKKYVEVEKTDVLFTTLDDDLINAYVATKEPLDKAGAYGIQGLGEILVEEIRGSYSNVVGLPLGLLRKMLQSFQIQLLPKQN